MPRELHDFIARYIVSIEKLEILLLLAESPQKLWTADEVFQHLQSSQVSVFQRLQELETDGFLESTISGNGTLRCYRYCPKDDELRAKTTALDAAYRERRVRVIEAIFSKSAEQIRQFSDAFKFRKDDSNG